MTSQRGKHEQSFFLSLLYINIQGTKNSREKNEIKLDNHKEED